MPGLSLGLCVILGILIPSTAMGDRRLISFILPDGLFIPNSLVLMLWCQSHKLRSLAFFSPLYFSVAQSCPTLCNPMECSAPNFPVRHHLEFAQTYVHWIRDAIQPSHPLSPPSPSCPQSFPASVSFPMSQVSISCGRSIRASVSASVLPMNIQGWFPLVCQGCILSQCLFNIYAEYIMRNAGLEEAEAGIKIAGRNINNLRYADDSTIWQKAKN